MFWNQIPEQGCFGEIWSKFSGSLAGWCITDSLSHTTYVETNEVTLLTRASSLPNNMTLCDGILWRYVSLGVLCASKKIFCLISRYLEDTSV